MLFRSPPSIGLTKAIVKRLALLVTTDSGPRHFAAAFGRPVVTLFGPTHVAWTETYHPLALHLQPCFAYLGCRRGSLPVTEAAMDSVISLPIYPELTHEQQDAVIEAVQSFYA